ncbi:2-phosphosulfolactate phosphatase [Nocardia asteroides]|uniref:2-phosphosulfolactate phosphatase n=1 Tax=Nocardia asteroides TaxID=1824 RepID=UPI001E365CBB|nr:2-phosphosulfolactate phosphatase [Nocardia asteroides]UGT61164.1 2-phosphosulfolactate phosphatase [Nocardia asteroides]
MNPEHRQGEYRVRFDWGPVGAEAVRAEVTVVVDVLSFTTTLSVAADLGIEVFPYRWGHDGVAEYAAARGAVGAVGRRVAGPGQVSLSPGTIRRAAPFERLVLPSPNGSTIAHRLAAAGSLCAGASLRNAAAVAEWIGGRSVAVVAAGERWPDGSLRPAVEDLWGAGAVLANLRGREGFSPEARMAVQAWLAVEGEVGSALRECGSGRELIAGGYPEDVAIAGEVGVSGVVPVLAGERFRPGGG